jgi:hypothetical protein
MRLRAYHHRHMRGLRVRRLQCDEIWAFVGVKGKNVMEFRNISTDSESGLEYVELRLVRSSEYSLITPEGGWRSDN